MFADWGGELGFCTRYLFLLAGMAPASSTCTDSNTRLENKQAKGRINFANLAGKVDMMALSWWSGNHP